MLLLELLKSWRISEPVGGGKGGDAPGSAAGRRDLGDGFGRSSTGGGVGASGTVGEGSRGGEDDGDDGHGKAKVQKSP